MLQLVQIKELNWEGDLLSLSQHSPTYVLLRLFNICD